MSNLELQTVQEQQQNWREPVVHFKQEPNEWVRPNVVSPQFGSFFKKRGVYDGKVFSSDTKVTYTFVSHNEVISLHFDKSRKMLFYNGHSISNIQPSPEIFHHLKTFEKVLHHKDEFSSFAKALTQVLKGMIPPETG